VGRPQGYLLALMARKIPGWNKYKSLNSMRALERKRPTDINAFGPALHQPSGGQSFGLSGPSGPKDGPTDWNAAARWEIARLNDLRSRFSGYEWGCVSSSVPNVGPQPQP
jgi:hypothetical protein